MADTTAFETNGLIESAVARPLASCVGKDLYPDPLLPAAVLWLGLIKNHCFVDANERTATMACRGGFIGRTSICSWSLADLVEMAVRIANSGIEIEELATWLKDPTEPVVG